MVKIIIVMAIIMIHAFPLTDCIGSTTTATARSDKASKLCWVLISTPDNQQPKPGCEWYQPTTISGRPVCFSISSIFAWKTGSTASTETPCKIDYSMGQQENIIGNGINTHCSGLRHCENINDVYCIFINKFSKHETHNLKNSLWRAYKSMSIITRSSLLWKKYVLPWEPQLFHALTSLEELMTRYIRSQKYQLD